MPFLLLLIVLVIAAACQTTNGHASASPAEALVNVTVIDGTGAAGRPGMTIVVRDRRIESIMPASRPLPAGTRATDMSGKFVIPGLVDAHVHLGTQQRPPGLMATVLRSVFMGGVTSVRDMGGRLELVRPHAVSGMVDTMPTPRVVYAAIAAGPGMWFDGERARFFAGDHPVGLSPVVRRVEDTTSLSALMGEARRAGASGIKIYNTVDSATVHALAREARAHGLAVWSHSYVNPAPPSNVVRAGASVVSHADGFIYEAMSDAARRGPLDSVRAARHAAFLRTTTEHPAIRELIAEMKRRGTILDATLFIMRAQPDSAGHVDERRAALFRGAVEFTRHAHRAGVDVAAGTDAIGGSTPNLHVELQLLADSVGLTPLQVIRSATLVNARALGISDSVGTLAPGMIADLVVLDADPSVDIANTITVSAVMKAGRLFRRERPMPTPPTARSPRRAP